jgi:hypothetical protein
MIIKPIEWKLAGHAYVGHVLGIVYYIDPMPRGAGYKTICEGTVLYEGAHLSAAQMAAQEDAESRVREVLA